MNENWWIFIIETLAITLIGSLLHFTYGWSRQNKFVAIFSAVNESTWEHIKLALSGIFVCMLVDIWFLGDNPNYWLARSLSFIAPAIVIPILFYGYQVFIKHTILPVDIAIFVVAAAASSGIFIAALSWPALGTIGGVISLVVSVVIIAAYLLLTRFPLHGVFLFEDPITHEYGYDGHRARKSKRTKIYTSQSKPAPK